MKVVEFMAKKYYVVWEGRKKGIFSTWDEAKQAVEQFPGAKFKAFLSLEEAKQAFHDGPAVYLARRKQGGNGTFNPESICVDAACSGNPGPMEYRGVYTKTGKTLFHYGPILGTNNIGEFLAIVHALAYLRKKNLHDFPVYSDSETAIKWVKMKRVNTTLPKTKDTERVWELIERAEDWLRNNYYRNPIYKWQTEFWGENRADFGRK